MSMQWKWLKLADVSFRFSNLKNKIEQNLSKSQISWNNNLCNDTANYTNAYKATVLINGFYAHTAIDHTGLILSETGLWSHLSVLRFRGMRYLPGPGKPFKRETTSLSRGNWRYRAGFLVSERLENKGHKEQDVKFPDTSLKRGDSSTPRAVWGGLMPDNSSQILP